MLTVNPVNPDGRIKAEIHRMDVPFPVLSGRGSRIIIDYDIRGLPKIVIIDKQGLIVTSAPYIEPEELKATVQKLLEK